MRNVIHNGDSTQTHDQVIRPINFNTINAMVSSPGKLIPADDVLFIFLIL